MKKTPDLPEEKPSAADKRDFITADAIKVRILARQKLFRICPRQRGFMDANLAGSIAFLAVCACALWWLP